MDARVCNHVLAPDPNKPAESEAAFTARKKLSLVYIATDRLPQAKEAAHGDAKVLAAIKAVEEDPLNSWRKGLSPEDRKKIDEFYKQRYGN